MKSSIMSKLFENPDDIDNIELQNLINSIKESGKFPIFVETMDNLNEELLYKSELHGITHNERVAIFIFYIGVSEGLDDRDLKILLEAAKYHDIGRINNGVDATHGKRSAEKIDDINMDLSAEEKEILKVICECHSIADKRIEEKISNSGIEDIARCKKLSDILKDADALDRVRLKRDKLDPSYLRTNTSKEMIVAAEQLYNSYNQIKQDIKFEPISNEVFNIDKFNVIEDEENYYVFRALNSSEHIDIEENITSDNGDITRIRTDRERYENRRNKTAKYSQDSDITLEEVYDHIKIKHSRETNCISLSSNANVILDYGQAYTNEYIMVKVPKKNNENVYPAGQYMLQEVESKINELLVSKTIDANILDILTKIDNETVPKNISQIVSEAYKKTNTDTKTEQSVNQRFNKKQYFSEHQQLQYNRIIAKLTVLELYGELKSILPTQPDNTSLIATIGMAFSSGELIHYKDIEKNEFVNVLKETMEALALFQQLKDKEPNNEEIKSLESKFIEFISSGNSFTYEEQEKGETLDNFSVENMYKLTHGKIAYGKAKIAVEFAQKVGQSKLKASEYARLMQETFGISDELADKIRRQGYAIDKDIISREDNIGFKVAESVNIGLTREQRRLVSNREQLAILDALQNLSSEQIKNIAQTNGLELESTFLDKLLDSKDEITENEYFAESIVDGIDFEKVYKKTDGKRVIDEQERQKLIEKLKSVDCKRIYSVFANMGKNHNVASQYIVNLLIDGYKGMSLEEISRMDNLEEFITENKWNIKPGISPVRLDRLLGIEDDAFAITGTGIRLRDYQKETLDNINEIFEEKRFAGMVLPTGAGKSFVAMSEMLRYRNYKILFVAPQITILNQFKQHIEKSLGKDYFPHLEMFCYKTLEGADLAKFDADEDFLARFNADLIIFDEAHRTGAPTWEPKIKKLLEKNPNAKILAMTATPERDVDHKNMMSELARICGDYSTEEILRKKHLSSEMDVLDAMQDDIVVTPKVVTFDYNLDQSEQYQEVKKMLQEEKDPEKKAKLEATYKEMTATIKKAKLEGMNKVFNDNIQKKNGRYIIFLPNNNTGLSPDEYMKQQAEIVKEYFKDIDTDPSISYLISDREGGKEANLKALEEFEDEKEEHSDHLKLIFAIDMLNEGVHVSGIDGVVMLRPIGENSKILYKQQIGRCIYSLDPNKPVSDEDRPIIFDVYNNYLAQNMHREANRTTPTSDLERLKRIVNWIERHKGYMPDINSEDTKEAKKAIALKNIQKKYKKYLDGIENKKLNESEIYEIQSILELGKTIDLWELEIPNRIVPPGEKEIGTVDTFKVTGTQKEFMELFRKAKSIVKDRKLSDNLRVKNALLVFDLLTEYGIEINNETIKINDTIADVLANIPEDIRLVISDILEENGIDNDLKIGAEYNFVKSKFFYGAKLFEGYKLNELHKWGILESFENKNKGKEKVAVNSKGFVSFLRGGNSFDGFNIKTGSKYDENGYDKYGYDARGYGADGYDKYGYAEDGYNRNGYNRNGKDKDGYDSRGWNDDGINKDTGTIWNRNGYDKDGYDKDGFNSNGWDRNGINRETGTQWDKNGWNIGAINKETGTKYDKDGFNKYGYDSQGYERDGFNIKGIHKCTGTKYNEDGFNKYGYDAQGYGKDGYNRNGIDREGYDRTGWNSYGINKETGTQWDKNGWDKKGINKVTMTRYDQNHRDRDGFDREGWNDDGINKETGTQWNKKGWSREGINKETGTRWDKNGEDIHGVSKETGESRFKFENRIYANGFDRMGYYHEKQDDGTYKNTGLKYNSYGFKSNGKHIITNTTVDLRFFYENGICKKTNTKYDLNGFKQDGTYMETGEMYYNGYNAWGVDREGKNSDGRLHDDINFTRKYIMALSQGKRNSFLVEMYGRVDYYKILREVDKTVYRASQMYPAIKDEIIKFVSEQKRLILQREILIEKLQKGKEDKTEEIAKRTKEIEILKQRIRDITLGER